jgi:cell division protease FtsH
LGRILRSGGLLYFIILMVFAVILVRVLSAGNPDVEELNNLQFRQAVENKASVTNPPRTIPTGSPSRTKTRR